VWLGCGLCPQSQFEEVGTYALYREHLCKRPHKIHQGQLLKMQDSNEQTQNHIAKETQNHIAKERFSC